MPDSGVCDLKANSRKDEFGYHTVTDNPVSLLNQDFL